MVIIDGDFSLDYLSVYQGHQDSVKDKGYYTRIPFPFKAFH